MFKYSREPPFMMRLQSFRTEFFLENMYYLNHVALLLRLCKHLFISSISLLCILDVAFCTIVTPLYRGFKDQIRSNSSHNTAVVKKLHRKPIRLFGTKSNDWPYFVHFGSLVWMKHEWKQCFEHWMNIEWKHVRTTFSMNHPKWKDEHSVWWNNCFWMSVSSISLHRLLVLLFIYSPRSFISIFFRV